MTEHAGADRGAREVALSLLEEVDRGRRLDLAWEGAASALPPRERGWVHEAVFGTQRLRGRIDHLLSLHLHRGIESVPVPLLRVLRLGAYQLLEMGSVPGYAAVSQAVDQARAVGGERGAALANAVLRALSAAGGGVERFPSFDLDPAGHLATWGSHPRWLVDRWVARMGGEGARAVVEAGNRIPELFLSPVGIEPEAALERLLAAGVAAEPVGVGERSLRLPRGTDPAEVLALLPGIIQDPAAARVVDFVAVRPGERVADLCAAPGGKGIGLHGLGGWVVGADPSSRRLRRMRGALRRLALPERLVVARGEAPPFRPLDVVLVDAPCTGTGTLSRHPDARWRLDPGAPIRMAEIQAEILEGARSAVRPGGRLVYATCTLEEEENEGMIRSFLARHPDFELEGPTPFLRLFPGPDRTDGAFAARLRREP